MDDWITLGIDVITILPQPLFFAWLLCRLQPMRRPALVMSLFTGIILVLHVLFLWALVVSPAVKMAVMFFTAAALASLSLVLIYMALMVLAELLTMFLALLILKVGPGSTMEDFLIFFAPYILPMRILYTACFLLLLIPLFFAWKRLVNKGAVYYTPALLPALLLQSAMTLSGEMILMLGGHPAARLLPAILVTVACSYGALLAVVWVYCQEQRRHALQLRGQAMQQEQHALRLERSAAAARAEEIATIRQELERRLRDVAGALNDLCPGNAKARLDQTAQWLRDRQSPQLCENLVVNTVVTQQQHRCRAAGITLDCSLDLPEELGLEETALRSVFSNLLNNAFRACAALPEGERSIRLSAALRGPYLIVKEKNPLPPVPSFPEDGNEHGMGLGILREIALQHGGDLELSREGGVFSVTLWLRLGEKSIPSPHPSEPESDLFFRPSASSRSLTPLWFLPLSQLTMVVFVILLWGQYQDILHYELLGLMILLGLSTDLLLLRVFHRLRESAVGAAVPGSGGGTEDTAGLLGTAQPYTAPPAADPPRHEQSPADCVSADGTRLLPPGGGVPG